MGVEYNDHPILVDQKDKAIKRVNGKRPAPSKEKKPVKAKGQRRVVRKCKASEPGDVQLGRELARLSKKSQKFTLGGSDCDSVAVDMEGVREALGVASFYVRGFRYLNRFLIGICGVFIFSNRVSFSSLVFSGYLDVWVNGTEKAYCHDILCLS